MATSPNKIGIISNKRNTHLDAVKFVLIALVIVGHWAAPTRYSNPMSGAIYSIIYAFHMPLFVLISGYFTKVDDLTKLNRRSLLLLETYLLIMGAQCILYRDYHHLIIPENSGWYILSLIFWGYMTRAIRNYRPLYQILIAGSIALLVFQFSPGKYEQIFSFMRTILYFPLFIVGYIAKNKSFDITKQIDKRTLRYALIVLSIFICILLSYFSGRKLHVFEFNRDSLSVLMNDWNLSATYVYCIKIAMGGAFALLCILLLNIVRFPAIFAFYGQHSLLFYTMQAIIVHFYRDIIGPTLIHSLIGSVITITLCCLLCKTTICHHLTNPISAILKKYQLRKG